MNKYLIYLGAFGLLILGINAELTKMPIWLLLVLEIAFMILVIVGCKEKKKIVKKKAKEDTKRLSGKLKHTKDKVK